MFVIWTFLVLGFHIKQMEHLIFDVLILRTALHLANSTVRSWPAISVSAANTGWHRCLYINHVVCATLLAFLWQWRFRITSEVCCTFSSAHQKHLVTISLISNGSTHNIQSKVMMYQRFFLMTWVVNEGISSWWPTTSPFRWTNMASIMLAQRGTRSRTLLTCQR